MSKRPLWYRSISKVSRHTIFPQVLFFDNDSTRSSSVVHFGSFVSFALKKAVFNVILVYGFRGSVVFSGGSSSRMSIDIPSLAMTANFSMICQRSHCKGGSSVGLSQKGSIARSARSLVFDCAM